MQEMVIYGVSFDMVGKQPIVLLKTVDGNKFLPIWIGHPEAASILMKLQGAGTPRPITCVPVPNLGYDVYREEHPRAPTAGLATYRVSPGDVVHEGDVIAVLRDIYARPIGDGVVRTEKAGWVIGLCAAMPVYRNTYLAELAVRDTEPLVVRYPG